MADRRYEPNEIEPKWQELWAREHTWEVANESDGSEQAYVLEMLPYPSGEPHIGHLKNYALGDAIAHFRRRIGQRVLHPMGYDAFGLPAENHAINTGIHPRQSTDASIAAFQKAFRSWGISIDWSREFATHEPSYYRWTQWIFVKLLERDLAYRKEAAVKWCPHDQTVLANEQVIDGRCERCGHEVEVRQLEQWFFRITDYADRLLDDLDSIAWPEHVKAMQRNWIGRSTGAEVTFRCEELGIDYPVFTTRPDTLFGATFFVMAPEHPDVFRLAAGTEREYAVHEYVNRSLTESVEERGAADKPKTGVALGRTVTNPVNGEQLPMFVADYVLMEYGTGAIMAVPAHDERDYAFAQAFTLPIRRVIADLDSDDPGSADELPYTGDGPMVNSGEFDGTDNREAYEAIVDWLDREGRGHVGQLPPARLALSRQRYWGCPIPVVYCDTDGLVPVPDEELPIELPEIEEYQPKGRSPLAAAEDWSTRRARLRRPGSARDRHDGHVRRFELVLPALLRTRATTGGVAASRSSRLDARRPVHRRHRARDPPPHVRALLREGARRHGAARIPGAVPGAVHPGHDPRPGRTEDVEVPRQRDQPDADRRALRRRRGTVLHPVHRAAGSGRGVVGGIARRRAPLPLPRVAARRRTRASGRRDGWGRIGRAAGRPGGRLADARPQGPLGDRQGHA